MPANRFQFVSSFESKTAAQPSDRNLASASPSAAAVTTRIVRVAAAYARDSPAGRPESHSTAAPTSPHRTAVRRIRCRPTRDPSHGLSRAARSESRPNPVRGAGAVDPRLLRAGGHAGHDVPGQLLLPGRLRGPRPLPGRHRVPQPGPLQQREGGAKTGRALAECAGHIETARFGATAADAHGPFRAPAWFSEGGERAVAGARIESERGGRGIHRQAYGPDSESE